MTDQSTSTWDIRPWMLTILSAACYPFLLNLFFWAMTNFNGSGQTIYAATATLVMVYLFMIPLMALWTLRNIKNSHSPSPAAQRTLIYLIFAVSPLYIVTLNLSGLLGLGPWHSWLWVLSLLACGFLLIRKSGHIQKYHKSIIPFESIQKIHRYSAFLLIFGFISLHLTNHLFALSSNALHEEYRLLFNSWYQSDFVEPVLFTLIGTMAITGLLMVRRYSGTDGDLFRTLQISAGLYMLFFFMAHINAILSARFRGTETDWIFATGEVGLINGLYILIPYYILAVLMILLHISLGLRRILLANMVSQEKANRTFYIVISAGSIITLMIGAAVLGVKL